MTISWSRSLLWWHNRALWLEKDDCGDTIWCCNGTEKKNYDGGKIGYWDITTNALWSHWWDTAMTQQGSLNGVLWLKVEYCNGPTELHDHTHEHWLGPIIHCNFKMGFWDSIIGYCDGPVGHGDSTTEYCDGTKNTVIELYGMVEKNRVLRGHIRVKWWHNKALWSYNRVIRGHSKAVWYHNMTLWWHNEALWCHNKAQCCHSIPQECPHRVGWC